MYRNTLKRVFIIFGLVFSHYGFSAAQINLVFEPKKPNAPVYLSQTDKQVSLELTRVEKCVNVTATLWQFATRLGSVLVEQPLIDCTKSKLDFTQNPIKLGLHFKTPKVKRESQFKWEFTSCDTDKQCQVIGGFDFSVVAEDLLQPIQHWAKKHMLYVYDKSNILQSFLDKNSIEYIETKRLVKKDERLISLIVAAKQDRDIDSLLPVADSQAVIVFYQYPNELPVIIDRTLNDKPLIEVHMPIVETLESDAAAQKMLLKLFYRLPQTKLTDPIFN